ncbi:MAG: Hpt domain-containing protein [Spirochaetaceae bacterium]|nr:Hpt domain-containing protein [Spirochaetaceae bacterium]
MAIEIPGLDVNSGLDLCDGDLNIYLRILRSYVSDMRSTMDKIQNVSEQTLQDYAVSVHGIKSTSEAVGAEELRKTAKELEKMAKSNDLAGVLAKNNDFLKYAENLIEGIELFLEQHSAEGESRR